MLKPERSAEKLPCLRDALQQEEGDFYGGYEWSLNPHLTAAEAMAHLGGEIAKLQGTPADWRSEEVVTNIYLLACGLLNLADEYLRGSGLRLPAQLLETPLARGVGRSVEAVSASLHRRRLRRVCRWRTAWLAALDDFLALVVSGGAGEQRTFIATAAALADLLKTPLPADLRTGRIGVPSPFRRLDLTHHDAVALGKLYAARFPDGAQAVLLVGLRTSGSYLAPPMRALLAARGYGTVALATVNPNLGPGRREWKELRRYAGRGYVAVVVDDSPNTGGTIRTVLTMLARAGFARDKLRAAVPANRADPEMFADRPDVVCLPPDLWHKRKLLDPEVLRSRLVEYFAHRNFACLSVSVGDRIAGMDALLDAGVADERSRPLKGIFKVELKSSDGRREVRHVLVKSVGWGWLGYHAFLAGSRLAGFVPPILGLRDGMLYMEWIAGAKPGVDNASRIDVAASYVAARTRRLRLAPGATAIIGPPSQHNGIRVLLDSLCRAYGPFPMNVLARGHVKRTLRRQICPVPTLIDGNMRREEWVDGPQGPLKTDYEHHGLGKGVLNVVDPAYDLADTIMRWRLDAAEEGRLVRRYTEESGDAVAEGRLAQNKLLAGLWAMKLAHVGLCAGQSGSERQQALHRQFITALDFLTVHMARHCGNACRPAVPPSWRAPVFVTDIDGVLDRRLFGFPATSAAGIAAIAALHARGLSVVVDTARSAAEVRAYCEAYGFAGGVGEHGAYVWDAVGGRGRCLLDAETREQIEEVERRLRRIPGVFLDERHRHSIRAFTYRDRPRSLRGKAIDFVRGAELGAGVLTPLPTLLVRGVLSGLARLSFHHTSIDTTIVAAGHDKGTGLAALRDWVLGATAETVAVGDQNHDLPMFAAATRSYAPANIGCAREAREAGCRIVRHAYQRGLLDVVRTCAGRTAAAPSAAADALEDALEAADRSWAGNLAVLAGLRRKGRP
jgi:hydroxymethylpyrimidine pyrophosphatase-like HAD family hydrolase